MKQKLHRIQIAATSATSPYNLVVSLLWALYHPPHRNAPETLQMLPGALGFVAENGTAVRYGSVSYWWYCVFG